MSDLPHEKDDWIDDGPDEPVYGERLKAVLNIAGETLVYGKAMMAAEKMGETHFPPPPKRGLGRGLDALFADAEGRIEARSEKREENTHEDPASRAMPPASVETSGLTPSISSGTRQLPIAVLVPGPFQPRRKFDEAELKSLADSIAAHGILQPLLVRPSEKQTGKFEIIAGERRWRAAQMARLHDVPVVIRDFTDSATLEIGLIENIQRADLTPIEEAEGYHRLIEEFHHTQEQLAEIVGKSRSHVTNTLRLLTLPEKVRAQLHVGLLSAGHARQLVGAEAAEAIAAEAIAKKWSVRELEKHMAAAKRVQKGGAFGRMSIQELNDRRRAKNDKDNPYGAFPGIDHPMPKDDDVLELEREMGNLLGIRTEIQTMIDHSGVMAIYFSSLDQLDELLQKLTRASKS